MIGMALLKNGFLLGQWDRQRYWRWAFYGVVGGGILSAIAAYGQYASAFNPIIVINTQMSWMILPQTVDDDRLRCGFHLASAGAVRHCTSRTRSCDGAGGVHQLPRDQPHHDNHILWLWVGFVRFCRTRRTVAVCIWCLAIDAALVKTLAGTLSIRADGMALAVASPHETTTPAPLKLLQSIRINCNSFPRGANLWSCAFVMP